MIDKPVTKKIIKTYQRIYHINIYLDQKQLTLFDFKSILLPGH